MSQRYWWKSFWSKLSFFCSVHTILKFYKSCFQSNSHQCWNINIYIQAKVSAPPGLSIKVNPSVLSFTCLKQKLSFTLTIEGTIDRQIVSASLIWDDGTFQVRSPIVVYIFWNSIYGTCITNIKHAKALVSKIKLIIKQKLWSNMLIKKDDWGDEITPQKMVVNLCCFIVINYSAPIKDCVFDM